MSEQHAAGPITRGAYPELTPHAVIVGYFLGIVLAVSIGYASLKLGFSIEGSELAAILGFGILRGLLRRRSIVENNVTQTVASAVNGASSGMMFSVPAIFILGYSTEFNPYVLTFGAIAGAFGVRGDTRIKSFCADPAAIADYAPLYDETGKREFSLKIIGKAKFDAYLETLR